MNRRSWVAGRRDRRRYPAIASVFLDEPDRKSVEACLFRSQAAFVPVSCLVELAVIQRFGQHRFDWLDSFIVSMGLTIVSIEAQYGRIAMEAARRYGKGSGHPAQLNFGDCLSYAVAKARDLPLLYVGGDFARTDIVSALADGRKDA